VYVEIDCVTIAVSYIKSFDMNSYAIACAKNETVFASQGNFSHFIPSN